MASKIKTTLIAGVDRSFGRFPIGDKFSNEKFKSYLDRGGKANKLAANAGDETPG